MDEKRVYLKRKRRKRKQILIGSLSIFVCLLVMAFLLIGRNVWKSGNKDIAATETSTEIMEERTSEDIQADTPDFSLLVSQSDCVEEEFAAWLYENHGDAYLKIEQSLVDGSYRDCLWYQETGRSIHVLKDEYAGRLDSGQSMKENLIYQKECANKDYVSLSFAGDISFAGDYAPGQNYDNYGMDAAFSKGVQALMAEPDIFMLNNEFAYTNKGVPQTAKGYIFRADPAKAGRLHEMGVDIVSIANNHAYDYGAEGFLDTIDTLDSVDMPYVGGGRNLEDARNHIVYFIANGIKIGYIAATQVERDLPVYTQPATEENPGVVRCYDPELVNEMIKQAKANCDFVIVYPHWGTELVNEIQDDQRALAQSFVDSGADFVIGGHAHVLQGAEYYKDVPIFYGLSNFCFSSRVRESCVVNLHLTIEGIEQIRFFPCMESAGITIQCDEGDSDYQHILDLMNTYSPNIHFDENGYVSKVE